MSKPNTVILPLFPELQHLLWNSPFVGCSMSDYNDALETAYNIPGEGFVTILSVVRQGSLLCVTMEQEGISFQEILLD